MTPPSLVRKLMDAIEQDNLPVIRHWVWLIGGPEKALEELKKVVSPKIWREWNNGATIAAKIESPDSGSGQEHSR